MLKTFESSVSLNRAVTTSRKARGAYYTSPLVARFLVQWAIHSPNDTVLDPGFGEGVFLRAGAKRISELGGCPTTAIYGVEVDRRTYQTFLRSLNSQNLFSHDQLLYQDFFAIDPTRLGPFRAIVGNPPFIRYQQFAGRQRTLALKCAANAGVRLTALSSAWAPFMIHSTSFLEQGGRLAIVAPAELCHASYARPVLRLLGQRFRSVRILTFERRLFPELSEDVVLVLADCYGRHRGSLQFISLRDSSALEEIDPAHPSKGSIVNPDIVDRPTVRLISYLLPEGTRKLYEHLTKHPDTRRLGDLATTGIGYVTGNNNYFHLSKSEAKHNQIPSRFMKPAVCRAAWLRGLIFTKADWKRLECEGHKTGLLYVTSALDRLPHAIKCYLRDGEQREIHLAYKCRVRTPWYRVPFVRVPNLFLTYMANTRPTLILNRAGATAPNTLLCIHLHPLTRIPDESVATSWWTSLTALSAEIEGHSLGGGMLKLEPREAGQILLPLPKNVLNKNFAKSLLADMDQLLRNGDCQAAVALGDREILQRGLGMSSWDCALLQQGHKHLMSRRRER